MFKKIIIFLLVILGAVIVYAGQAEIDESLKAISNGAIKLRYYVPVDGSLQFFNATGTLPPANTATVNGALFNITSSGSAAQGQRGVNILLGVGYTGSSFTQGLSVTNSALGTATTWAVARLGNVGGIFAACGGGGSTTGVCIGGMGNGTNAGSGDVIGLFGTTTGSSGSGHDTGVVGMSRGTVNSTGGYFGLTNLANPTIPSAGLVANNSNSLVPIFVGQDNSNNVFTIEDNGAMWSRQVKNLTETSVTNVFQLDVVSGTSTGAVVDYTVEADDGTDRQERTGRVAVNIVNKAGTETCTVGGFDGTNNPTETKDGSDISTTLGTLTYTWGQSNSPTNGCLFTLNATSSLTQTTLRVNYSVHELGNVPTAFTPQ